MIKTAWKPLPKVPGWNKRKRISSVYLLAYRLRKRLLLPVRCITAMFAQVVPSQQCL
jgi:hypothetical protein